MTDECDDYDNPWKVAIAVYFKAFIAFFLPIFMKVLIGQKTMNF
jgi:hypothetical protein